MIQDVVTPLSPRAFHDLIYAGEMLCFRALPATMELVSFTRAFAEAALAPHHPTEAHKYLSKNDQIARYGAFQARYSQSVEVKEHWARLFETIGLSRGGLARDCLYARVQIHDSTGDGPSRDLVTAPLSFHRDTWGCNLYAQRTRRRRLAFVQKLNSKRSSGRTAIQTQPQASHLIGGECIAAFSCRCES